MAQSGRKITFFRNRKQMNQAFKIIAWLTVFTMFAGYGILGIKDLFKKGGNAGIINVNGLSVSDEEFKRNYVIFNNFVNQIKSEYGPAADFILRFRGIDPTKKTEDIIMQNLIQDKVMQSLADSFEMKVGKDYLDTKLQDISFMKTFLPGEFFQGGRLNTKILGEYLSQRNMSQGDFESQINEVIRKSVLVKAVEGVGYIPDMALKNEFVKKYSKRKYSIISINLDEYLRQVKEKGVTDSELERYYKDHQEIYRVPEKRQANFWVFDPKSYGLVVEEKEINDYFNKNKDSYKKENSTKEEPVYKELSEIKNEIIDKVTINKFTKQFTKDVNRMLIESKQTPVSFTNFLTEKKSKSLPMVGLTENNKKQSQKIFELKKLKDKAFYVEDNKGYIGELVKIDKSYIPELKDIKEKVKQAWFKEKARELAEEVLTKLANNKEKTMQQISAEVKGKLTKTDFLDPQSPEALKDLKSLGIKNDMLFSLEAIGQRNVDITDFSGLIIQLDDIESIDQDLFEKKKAELRNVAKREQALHIFNDLLKDLEKRATIKIDDKRLAQLLNRR